MNSKNYHSAVQHSFQNPNAQAVTSSLLYWISSLKGSPDWRSQEIILSRISLIAEYLPSDELFAKVVPPLMEEILTQVDLGCLCFPRAFLILFCRV